MHLLILRKSSALQYRVRSEVIELSFIISSLISNISTVNKLVVELLVGFPLKTVQMNV